MSVHFFMQNSYLREIRGFLYVYCKEMLKFFCPSTLFR